jgi:hypothetical protein
MRARTLVLALWVLALICAGLGVWSILQTGSVLLLWIAAAIVGSTMLLGVRVARLRARRVAPQKETVPVVTREPTRMPDVSLVDERAWSPRTLPKPLTASQGSQASAVLDEADARLKLRQAALEEAMRERAEQQRPVPIESVRTAPAGALDDAAIEAHCRELLQKRAAG